MTHDTSEAFSFLEIEQKNRFEQKCIMVGHVVLRALALVQSSIIEEKAQ